MCFHARMGREAQEGKTEVRAKVKGSSGFYIHFDVTEAYLRCFRA